ncbi:MAG: SAF domain-containing protein [Bacillota bacterium]
MSKLRKISHIFIAITLASAAGVSVWYYVTINTPSVKVVVAKPDRITIGTVIGPQHVTLKEYPESVIPRDAEVSQQNVIGKTVVSGTIFQGDVIRTSHISGDVGSLKAVLASVAPGREALDLPAETAPGLKGVAVGDRVNVFTEIVTQQGKDEATIVECVAKEAVILATPATTAAGKPGSLGASMDRGAYIVAITPEESRKVAEGKVRGKKFSFSFLPKGGQ